MTDVLATDWHALAEQNRPLRAVPDLAAPSVADAAPAAPVVPMVSAVPAVEVPAPREDRLAAELVALTRVLLGVGLEAPAAHEPTGVPTTVTSPAPESVGVTALFAVEDLAATEPLDPAEPAPSAVAADIAEVAELLDPIAFAPIALPELEPLEFLDPVDLATPVPPEPAEEPAAEQVTEPERPSAASVLAEVAFLDL